MPPGPPFTCCRLQNRFLLCNDGDWGMLKIPHNLLQRFGLQLWGQRPQHLLPLPLSAFSIKQTACSRRVHTTGNMIQDRRTSHHCKTWACVWEHYLWRFPGSQGNKNMSKCETSDWVVGREKLCPYNSKMFFFYYSQIKETHKKHFRTTGLSSWGQERTLSSKKGAQFLLAKIRMQDHALIVKHWTQRSWFLVVYHIFSFLHKTGTLISLQMCWPSRHSTLTKTCLVHAACKESTSAKMAIKS